MNLRSRRCVFYVVECVVFRFAHALTLQGTIEMTRAMLERHPDAPPPNLETPFTDNVLKRAKNIVSSLLKMRQSIWFSAPVDEARLGISDYHTIIKHPMDLGTISKKLDGKEYACRWAG